MADSQTIELDTQQPYSTADEVRALNEAEPRHWPRYECVYGELLASPSPGNWHQIVAGRLLLALARYIDARRVPATVLMAPADISWGRRDVTVQPDVFVVPVDMMRDSLRTRAWSVIAHLMLAAEVVSPSSRHADRFQKRILYQRQRVPNYWVVDQERGLAEVWTPDAELPTVERERLVWHPEGADEPLVILLSELFAEP